jgi:putative ABC transport system permease protein
MFKNYFKIALRNLTKNKFYSAINIVGLSVGIAFTLLIAVYVWGELQVNHQLKNANNQYILQSKWKNPDMGYELTALAELPKALKLQYPNLIKNYCRWDGVTSTISKGDKHFREGILLVDSTLLNMYGFKLLNGDVKTALSDPFSVVISAEKANKYFGRTDVVGQTITVENFSGGKHDFLISGVLAKTGKNSVTYNYDDSNNDFFISISAARFMGRSVDGWNNTSLVGYLELKDGVTPKDLEEPMRHLIKNNSSAQISQNLIQYLVPLKTYYLSSNNGLVNKMIYTLSAIALFILLMAVINFINLCISRSSTRMREMGIRKVLGGLKKQLIWQFLIESMLMVMLSTSVALVLFQLVNPYFSNVLGKEIISVFAFPSWFFVVILGLALFIGNAAGIYPAFILSSLKSVDSLKGKLSTVGESVFMRKALMAFQFGMAMLVLIGALIISQQVKLFFSKDLGYNKDYVVSAQVPRDWSKKGVQRMESIRGQFIQTAQVTNASLSWEIPNGANGGNLQVYRQGADSTQAIASQGMATDNQYAATYDIPVKAGHFFEEQYAESGKNHITINATEAKALGWNDPKDAIGQQIRVKGDGGQLYTVDGVTADFHFGSMQQTIKPITIFNVNATTYYRYLSFKLKSGDVNKSLDVLQQKWATLLPGAPFEYKFMDDELAKLYKTEIQLKKASYVATTLAIIIAFLGIIGLISLSIQKRTKEIGIRKVLGSSIGSIISLFLKDFLVIIIIAGVVACPLAYLLMQQWLSDYAYKIAITVNPFILSITIIVVITTLLIVAQTIKAALANPVESLRSE